MQGGPGGTHQARSERDSAVSQLRQQIRQWDAAEHGLCFGRIDFDASGDDRLHIGRIGLFDDDYEPLLIDWRAPAARPFYLATAAAPGPVRRRRHIRTRLREVTGVDEEILDLSAVQDASDQGLVGEAALLGALNANRTGHMKDIVETIQAEQDRIIRAPLSGVLVVQGGPGTGKTAVALHRAAYLLYTHRESLTRQGVLILGPNETFLRYISQVLPGLGETSVLLCTLGDLFPGLRARREESAELARFKGSLEMLAILREAIAARQQVPPADVEVLLSDTHEGLGYQREKVAIDRETIGRAIGIARQSGKPHNLARPFFTEEIIATLARQIAELQGFDPFAGEALGGDDAPGEGTLLLDDNDVAEIRRELREDTELAAAMDELWPKLTPQRFLAEFYATTDIEALRREPGDWSPADVPLLDEAAELLGEDEEEARALTARLRRQIAYAEGVLDISAGSVSTDVEVGEEAEVLVATDILSASELAERQVVTEDLTASQRAATDRKWTFGHVIIDEAQELSPMAWRLLMRRTPSRSMTVAGDVAQTGDLGGARSWGEVFEPFVAQRWRLAELTVNYRTPAEIMELAAEVLAEIDPSLRPPDSVRASGVPPREIFGRKLQDVIAEEAALGGKIGVIVPQAKAAERSADLDSQVAILTVREAKGLEFDSVIVVDPDAIKSESPRGRNDLYVALTRATQRLTLLR